MARLPDLKELKVRKPRYQIKDENVEQVNESTRVAAAWMRTLRSSGRHVFSGCYSARTLPGADRPSVHAALSKVYSGGSHCAVTPRLHCCRRDGCRLRTYRPVPRLRDGRAVDGPRGSYEQPA